MRAKLKNSMPVVLKKGAQICIASYSGKNDENDKSLSIGNTLKAYSHLARYC